MRTVLITSKKIKLSNDIVNSFSNIKLHGIFNIHFNINADIECYDYQGNLILIDGLIKNLESLEMNGNFFKSNSNLNGQFSCFAISKSNKLWMANDFININRYAYYWTEKEGLIISNNLDIISDVLKLNSHDSNLSENLIDSVGIFQQLGGQYTTFGNRTLLKNVRYFPNGTICEISENGLRVLGFDSVVGENSKTTIDQIKDLIHENAQCFENENVKLVFPISGGVDSRITLFGFFKSIKKNTRFLTHGEIDDVEVKIAKRLANEFNVTHQHVSIQELYPDKVELNKLLKFGWNWVLGKWYPVIKTLGFKSEDQIRLVIGDTLDLLRAKNIKSIRSRKNRILIQLGIYKFDRTLFNVETEIENYKINIVSELSKNYDNYKELFKRLKVTKEFLINETESDIENTLFHTIELFKPKDKFQLEEGFNLINWGRGTMGNQARFLNQFHSCYVAHANRKFVKSIYEIDFEYRFEDKLVHKLLKKSKLSNYPTSQIPILPYCYPLWLKYTFWGVRSYIDQKYMKVSRKFGFQKNRLFNTQNWQIVYRDPVNSANYKSYFEGLESFMNYPLTYYDSRSSGNSRPLSEIDLTNAAQIAIILEKIGFQDLIKY
jgi:hypothetical protein